VDNPAAWHPDPTGRHEHRWWDGERWTEHVADAGQASVDPLDTGGATTTTDEAAGTSDDAGAHTDPSAGTASSWEQPGGWQQPGAGGGWGQPDATQPAGGQAWQQPDTTQPGGGQQWQQPQQQWPQATPTAPGPATGTSGLAIFALILGILSLLFFWVPILGGVGALVAIILGFVGRSSAKKRGVGGAGMALGGAITGIVALVLNILVTMFLFGALGNMNFFGMMNDYIECMEEHDDEALCERELEDSIWDWLSD
jgi:hypothetical protein